MTAEDVKLIKTHYWQARVDAIRNALDFLEPALGVRCEHCQRTVGERDSDHDTYDTTAMGDPRRSFVIVRCFVIHPMHLIELIGHERTLCGQPLAAVRWTIHNDEITCRACAESLRQVRAEATRRRAELIAAGCTGTGAREDCPVHRPQRFESEDAIHG